MANATHLPALLGGVPKPPGEADGIELDHLVAAGFLARYKNPTRRTYACVLRQWFAWCESGGIRPLEAKRAHIELWARHLEEERHLMASTVGSKINVVAGYYKFAVIDGHLEGSPAAYVRRPRVERISTTNFLTRTQLVDLLNLVEKSSLRDHALFCLLGLNGLRVSEAVGLDVVDVGRDHAFHTVTVHRKGGRTQTLPLAHRTSWAIEQLLAGRVEGPLFIAKGGHRLNRGAALRRVKHWSAKAGIRQSISPHSFRHSFVTLSLDAGVSHRDVQNSAGHLDPRSTAYYDRNRESLARNATHALSAYIEGAA